MSGGLYNLRHAITGYFSLKSENQRLLEENERLYNTIHTITNNPSTKIFIDSTSFDKPYTYIKSRVIKNDYSKMDNYILIDKGRNDSISADMGVVTDKGIIGIIENTSKNYGRVISILNSNSRINAGLKKSFHYGSLVWNGKNPNIIQLETVPRQANIKKGDTIITHGRSTIFPKGIPIGVIESYTLNQNKSYYLIDVKLFNDMTNIGFVYVIKSRDADEVKRLEN